MLDGPQSRSGQFGQEEKKTPLAPLEIFFVITLSSVLWYSNPKSSIP